MALNEQSNQVRGRIFRLNAKHRPMANRSVLVGLQDFLAEHLNQPMQQWWQFLHRLEKHHYRIFEFQRFYLNARVAFLVLRLAP